MKTVTATPATTTSERPDPAAFALAFVNTLDPVRDPTDLLAKTADAVVFLSEWFGPLSAGDVSRVRERLVALRDRLRTAALALAAGRTTVKRVAADLAALSRDLAWRSELRSEGRVLTLAFRPDPAAALDRRIAALALQGFVAMLSSPGAERLRRCDSSPCEEVFLDTTRKGHRRFCSKRCATRHHVALFRERGARE